MALKKYTAIVLISSIVFFAILSAINIDGFLTQEGSSFAEVNDVFYKMFGQLRSSVAAILYIKADKYFHGGTSHEHGHGEHSCLEEEMKEPLGHKHAEQDKPGKSSRDIFARLNKAISYRPVQHLNNIKSAEIMPWFELAVLADPYYIKAYTIGAYWLGMRLGKSKKAIQFLRRGLKYNPNSWEIYAQMGDIYFIMNHDYAKSIAYFRQAYLFMHSSNVNNIEKKHVLTLLAASFEKIEGYEQSIYYYKQILDLYPLDKGLSDKIKRLQILSDSIHAVN